MRFASEDELLAAHYVTTADFASGKDTPVMILEADTASNAFVAAH